MDSESPAIGWGVSPNYPKQEGTFFGNIIVTGNLLDLGKPSVNAPVAYFCEGAGFTPAGRRRRPPRRRPANVPYMNPFGNGTLCKNSPANAPYYTFGTGGQTDPDGYQKLEMPAGVPWNNPITIWRNSNYVPKFDAGYRYSITARITQGSPMSLDATATAVQQWSKSSNLDSSKFNFTAVGSNWKITPKSDGSKCLDAGDGLGGRALVLAYCNGAASQSWSVTPEVQTGNFYIKVASTGRCINVRSGSTAQGAIMEVADCNTAWDSEKFMLNGLDDSSSGSLAAPPAGTNPCAAYCASPTVFTGTGYNSGNLGTGAMLPRDDDQPVAAAAAATWGAGR